MSVSGGQLPVVRRPHSHCPPAYGPGRPAACVNWPPPASSLSPSPSNAKPKTSTPSGQHRAILIIVGTFLFFSDNFFIFFYFFYSFRQKRYILFTCLVVILQ